MTEKNEWISLKQAAELLGVHPATVRNWADEGKIASNRTAGGHRRFLRGDLTKFSQPDQIQPIEVQLILQNALGQARMEVGDGALAKQAWYVGMKEPTRHTMRILGREILDGLKGYLAEGAKDDQLASAIRLGKDYASALSADALTLPQAMRGFFYFSEFIINSVLTWSEVTLPRSPHDWATLLRQVNTYMNAMLLSLVEYYEEE
jgi:excisionase family DNA binding protein